MEDTRQGEGGVAVRARRLPAELVPLSGLVEQRALAGAAQRAARNGTAAHEELMAAGLLDADGYARAVSQALDVPFDRRIAPQHGLDHLSGHSPAAAARLGVMLVGRSAAGLQVAASLRGAQAGRLVAALNRRPQLRRQTVLTTPQAFTDALVSAAGPQLREAATGRLDHAMPGLSARDGLAPWQAAALQGALVAVLGFGYLAPPSTLLALLILASVFFLGVCILRLVAVGAAMGPGANRSAPSPLAEAELPVYTVLVPLYREANMVAPLIDALDKLDYPRAKLDIKLIVEADDPATEHALRRRRLAAWYEIVTVPPGPPRTKPRALNVALELARGALVTVFDAEDRPEPDQLRRAAAAFHAAPAELGCLQARLAWYNWDDGWLTRQLAIEYASIFDVLLPALDRLDLPIPLGGTSNHFRLAALRAVGAWDAYNVTEDADLGIRLARAGWHCGVLDATTWEEAPNRFMPWLRQRTRWLKGWMQTYIVHMRRPGELLRRLGWWRFLAVQVMVGGVVASTLVHPVFSFMVAAQALAGDVFLGMEGWVAVALVGLGAFNLAVGYMTAFALGMIALRRRPMPHVAGDLALLPFYWLVISIAAYRALWQIAFQPFRWEKTQHGLARELPPLPILAVRRRWWRAWG